MTEQTETADCTNQDGWVLNDGDYPMCVRLAGRFTPILHRHGFDLAPLQSPWVRSRLGTLRSDPPDEMFVLSSFREVYGRADAVVFFFAAHPVGLSTLRDQKTTGSYVAASVSVPLGG